MISDQDMSMPIHLQLLGKAMDLRTDTVVVYGQMPVPDYLALVVDSFDTFDVQRKRVWHPAYRSVVA